MLDIRNTFSSFSVDDLEKAQEFYSVTIGLETERNKMGLRLLVPGGGTVFLYPRQDHHPASFTVLNFVVGDLDGVMQKLKNRGVEFEYYEGLTTENRVHRGLEQKRGPDIAWFKDPAGNIISVLQMEE